ncbi:disulfide bond formation protein DsbA [Patescibacteria group bacterium]|nr:MAG: disulfide bond formation protein DsbA [Patescibacteria group bacterium]
MDPNQETKHNPLLIPLSIIIAGAFVGIGIYFAKTANPREIRTDAGKSALSNLEEITVNPLSTDDHILGNPNASVVIIEFSDTECPFCKTFHPTLKRVISDYGKEGKVAWVYRHFPLDALHSKARKEAEATECAAELGGNAKFWEYLDLIFLRTPSNNGLDPVELPKIAKDVGLDVKKFESCLSSGRHADKVQSDYEDAVRSGGRGTPHSVLITKDGQKVSIQGAQAYDALKIVIDTALVNIKSR